MRRITVFLMVLGFMVLYAPATAHGIPYLVNEPALESRVDWDLTPSGLLLVAYDSNGDGRADYFTLRPVIASFYSRQGIAVVRQSYPGRPVFDVQNGADTFYYIVGEHPLMYAVDLDGDGVWDLIYKDVAEDGINGNEAFYDSPSGMFTAEIMKY